MFMKRVMSLTVRDRSTLSRALDLETRFDAGIFPSGAGQFAHYRRLEKLGLLREDGWGRDIDRQKEDDVLVFRLTEAGRARARNLEAGAKLAGKRLLRRLEKAASSAGGPAATA